MALIQALFLVEIAMSLFILYVGIRAKKPLIVLLTLAQAGLMVWFELTAGEHLEVAQNLYVDNFAVIMALINGIVGGGICLYALGYMREYHEVAHRDVRDRRPLFFALLFIFMGAMFGLDFCQQPRLAVPVLGNHHAVLVPADWLHADRRSETQRVARAGHEPGRRTGFCGGHRLVSPADPAASNCRS